MTRLHLFVLSVLAAAPSFAGDGCFQIYETGSLYPVICVQGSIEEGIGGSNAFVALVHAGKVIWCGKTTKIDTKGSSPTTNKSVYHFNKNSGMLTIEFNGAVKDGREEGNIVLTEVKEVAKLKYLELRKEDVKKLPKVLESKACQDAKK